MATGERIVLPSPSYVPVLNAAGLAALIAGLVLGWVLFAFGAALFLVTTLRWIADTRRFVAALPPPAE